MLCSLITNHVHTYFYNDISELREEIIEPTTHHTLLSTETEYLTDKPHTDNNTKFLKLTFVDIEKDQLLVYVYSRTSIFKSEKIAP